jgi:hypothetical protein
MKFNLNARWAVETEEIQVTISRRRVAEKGKNKGKEYLSPSYYYNNMEQALFGLIDRDINGLEKVEEIVERISELKVEIKNMLKFGKLGVSDFVGTTQIKKTTCDKGEKKSENRKKGKKQSLSD